MQLADKNITIWGDSILKGVILDEQKGKYKVMENNCINSFAEITGCTVRNNAHFGMTSTRALDRITASIDRQQLSKNDIVIIEFGGNDCDFNWCEIAKKPDALHQPKTTIDNFKCSLQNMIDMFKKKGITPIMMNLPPLEPERYFNWISRGLNKENILHWLGDVAKIYRWQEAYNNAAEWIARQNNCRLLNVRESFLISNNYSSHFCADGIHPNEKGQRKILESFLAFSF
ncbi:lysophospholipase L1-like esterase [Ruminiclostridium sufflavum DSM 19573]|uniref:Lysophospholipase L1-like esterase n=1 Tax=Ruminiclostridium sufflavum DSM 19573 TaxID=1121337 RepID=A0A318Y2W4_9FIRM|nr:SGNH/GDSL hydrolase family protein [Ruminiclostridium sufflavum]PYG85816.1 lysophospholipase L1-like esterase [Ruminiclostridium sufflavum DSM 19573]